MPGLRSLRTLAIAWLLLAVPGMAFADAGTNDARARPALASARAVDPVFGQPSVRLALGSSATLQYGTGTSRASLPSGAVRYRRFALDKNGQDVKISVRVIADKHDGRPRFTVFSPQLVILDQDGQIRRIVPLDHLQLDIRPFRATRLRECVVVRNLSGFLLASDPGRLGQLYQFTARRTVSGHPDHGFYRASSPMRVFLTYSDSGPVEVEVTRAPRQGSACRAIPD